ncbi:hypothetical protein [Stieleria varia]|uniref:Uncharacterized protein n=1 Tax=Stieleria varia TaxID=2528005 RepID=A0A5C6ATI3_9BACT|nr:hypothetical protein [Stieleria varia]TWU02322.1 hypothetical protein Pla52n_33720 [Stieleria varia]
MHLRSECQTFRSDCATGNLDKSPVSGSPERAWEFLAFGDTNDPRGFYRLLVEHTDRLRIRNYSEATIKKRITYVREKGKTRKGEGGFKTGSDGHLTHAETRIQLGGTNTSRDLTLDPMQTFRGIVVVQFRITTAMEVRLTHLRAKDRRALLMTDRQTHVFGRTMKRLLSHFALFGILVLGLVACAHAKPPLKISFEKLTGDAETVAIVRCFQVMRVPNDEFEQQFYGEYVLLLEAVSVLKGEKVRILRIKHFQDLPEKGAPGNAPSSMYFGKASFETIRRLKLGESSKVDSIDSFHLVFLRKDKDEPEFLIPVTGHGDALQSSYELVGLGIGEDSPYNER